jgi:ADP-glucose pyrophosphorylase
LDKRVGYQTIQDIVNHKELELFFAEGNTKRTNHYSKEGSTIKPDRMVVTSSDEVYLLDYKTGIHNTKYQNS